MNLKLFNELKALADKQDGQSFNVIMTPPNPLQLMNDLYVLDDKNCIELEVNKFNYNEEDHSVSVETSGTIKRYLFSVV
jgi:hypothetical protein